MTFIWPTMTARKSYKMGNSVRPVKSSWFLPGLRPFPPTTHIRFSLDATGKTSSFEIALKAFVLEMIYPNNYLV